MPTNQTQFQTGLSLREFQRRFGTETQCREALLALRWPEGFVCPHWASAECSRLERQGRWY